LGLSLGAALFAVAAAGRYFLGDLSDGFEPITFLPAILLAGLFGGIRVGIAFFVVCMFTAWVWFFPPYGTFILTTHDATTMTVFTLTAVLELCVIRVLNIAINDLGLARERSNTLFRELQHRVANNLLFAAALLHTKKKTLAADSAGAHALEAARSRLDLMSRVHRRLHDPGAIDLAIGPYLEELSNDLIKASALPHIELRVKAPAVKLDLESLMSVSLIVAELVTNSLKHAFRDQSTGKITISLAVVKRLCTLTVADDGCGFSANAASKLGGLGQQVLRSLVSQLQGTVSFESNNGTTARIVFPMRHR
jgi:two-component sensor histidine kinase